MDELGLKNSLKNIIIKINKINQDAKIPEYAHDDDAGMDLFCLENKKLSTGQFYGFKTGIAMEIPDGYYGHICDKSGLAAKFGVTVLAGIVDSGYRGEIVVVLYNTSKKLYKFQTGDKIAQLLIKKVEHAKMVEVDQLSGSERSTNGFGSSGR